MCVFFFFFWGRKWWRSGQWYLPLYWLIITIGLFNCMHICWPRFMVISGQKVWFMVVSGCRMKRSETSKDNISCFMKIQSVRLKLFSAFVKLYKFWSLHGHHFISDSWLLTLWLTLWENNKYSIIYIIINKAIEKESNTQKVNARNMKLLKLYYWDIFFVYLGHTHF